MKRTTQIVLFFVIATSFLGLFGYLYADAGILFKRRAKQSDLPVIATAPTFSMVDSEGQQWSSSALKGKLWTFNFFFTSCEHICPTIVRNVQFVHNEFGESEEPISVAVSVDPERDTPEALRAFREKHALDSPRWKLLRAPLEQVRNLSEKELQVALGQEASLHSNRVFVIDRKGRIRGSYLALKPDEMKRLADDLRKLARES